MIILSHYLELFLSHELKNMFKKETFFPDITMQKYINYYRHIHSCEEIKRPISVIRIPDGSFCLEINYLENNDTQPGKVYGLTHKCYKGILSQKIDFVSIKISIGSIFLLTKIPAMEINRQQISLSDAFGSEILDIINRTKHCDSINEKIKALEEYLKIRIQHNKIKVPFFLEKIIDMLNTRKIFLPSEINEISQLSTRHTRRLFDRFIGVSPKKLSEIMRINNSIKLMTQKNVQDFSEIAVKSGFYDQPHFIKEFKKYTGLKPSQFRAEI